MTAANNPDAKPRVALVTGAGRGIGRAVTRRLLADGYHVGALDQDAGALADLQSGLEAGVRLHCQTLVADVSDEPAVQSAIRQLVATHGHLDVLVNNAGIADPFNGPIESLSLADWNRVIGTNLTGYFLCTKHAAPLLREREGCIVNMASSRAYQSEAHSEAYAASKGGIMALTHALSISLGPEIRVNAIAPGWIDVREDQPGEQTPGPLRAVDHAQHPRGRVGRGDDIGGVVAFLCSADAAFVTGQTLIADGGMTRKMIYQH